ncbi:MAG: phosphotriesterase-related protein [Actinobacteria bacterium]|nr:phosphotriesterase-related protein [Actinomycetota bacterium]NIS30157.1 phosphotriesterase-related protein [Actinomycetota bacterium]NIT94896.1 phosphotriesterase-related protein [Actinomycetota bacterium]NIU18563.1 phosphotriesterase-related protein [Actinomycetota bacterium]NIU65411.1 phosphotriesterase-related protein [Actinomycetota bacterium]
MTTIQTVTGPIDSADLGRTLMHEHLTVGYPGWESATNEPFDRREAAKICIDHIEALKARGYRSMIDPCPSDLGRDVELMVEVAEATGFNIVCAVGLYKEDEGGHAHWGFRGRFEDIGAVMTDLFVGELTDGIGGTGVRPGLIKVGTGTGALTDHETAVFEAAAAAAGETGAPITTHTEDGTLGDVQQRVLTEAGVPAHRIVVGHSCGSTDTAYHMTIARGGSYLGFDRFGIPLVSDEDRAAALARVVEAGAGDRVVVSHDSVWCWKGNPWPVALREQVRDRFIPTRFDDQIIPMLQELGVTSDAIDRFTHDNPRNYFEGNPLPTV